MPIYEYKCHKCGGTFEVIQKFSDDPVKIHAGCGGEVERLISAAGLQFKGTGWYVTDYARSGSSRGSANGKNGTKGDSAEKKPDAKPESKPAETSSGKSS